MNSSQLTRVLGLIRKTHDRVVVLDPAGDDVVVLMHLGEYERLVGAEPYDWYGDSGDESNKIEPEDDFLIDADINTNSTNDFANDALGSFDHDGSKDFMNDSDDDDDDMDEIPPQTPEVKLKQLTPDWDETPRAESTEQGMADIAHEAEEPPFYLEPVE